MNVHVWRMFCFDIDGIELCSSILERSLEDHELILDVISKWENKTDFRLQMKSFAKKYEFFEKPSVSLYPHLYF